MIHTYQHATSHHVDYSDHLTQKKIFNRPQNQIHNNQLRRAEQDNHCLQKCVQTLTTQNKDLHVQLKEIKRRQAEFECKVQLVQLVHVRILHLCY